MIVLRENKMCKVREALYAARWLIDNQWYDEARLHVDDGKYFSQLDIYQWYIGYSVAIPCAVAVCEKKLGCLFVHEVQAFASGKKHGQIMLHELALYSDGIWIALDRSKIDEHLLDYFRRIDFLVTIGEYVKDDGCVLDVMFSKNVQDAKMIYAEAVRTRHFG